MRAVSRSSVVSSACRIPVVSLRLWFGAPVVQVSRIQVRRYLLIAPVAASRPSTFSSSHLRQFTHPPCPLFRLCPPSSHLVLRLFASAGLSSSASCSSAQAATIDLSLHRMHASSLFLSSPCSNVTDLGVSSPQLRYSQLLPCPYQYLHVLDTHPHIDTTRYHSLYER